MAILLIDNHDSFTYNLAQLVVQAGGESPIVVKNDAISAAALDQLDYDAVILSPGPGRPERDRDFGICQAILARGAAPILGICLGHQGIGHAFGAAVVHAPEPMHGRISSIHHGGEGLFQGLPSPFSAVRYHSLLVEAVPDPLRVDARTAEGLVMALSHRSRPLWGVQFHPESISTEHGEALIANFLRLAQARRAVRAAPVEAPVPARRQAPEIRFPLSVREVPFLPPQACFDRLYRAAEISFWLDCSSADIGQGRYSYMGDASGPHAKLLRYQARDRALRIDHVEGTETRGVSLFDYLEAEEKRVSVEPCPGYDCPFKGGHVGFFGYELKSECGGEAVHDSPHDDGAFLFADRFVAFDGVEERAWLVCLHTPQAEKSAHAWFDEVERTLAAPAPPAAEAAPDGACWEVTDLEQRHSRANYIGLIDEALRQITDGESYEVCLTNQRTGRFSGDAYALYLALRTANPAPYSAFISFGDLRILSSSPECFLKISADGHAESKPIKGTIERGACPETDAALAGQLQASGKDRAENLMIVDLIRNDLNRVCKTGSVQVPKLFDIESFKTVHQMVSTVRGELRADVTRIAAVKSLFPGGSMTGAPKVRTMEIIDALEAGPRGIYSGALGYLSLDGSALFNIVIRTLVLDGNRISLGAGGAIVSLSDPDAEYEETLTKSSVLMRAARMEVR
ncbi:MAG TPA: aminodeoxychorismate synthase component I [Allosphingosinicella sp.]|nr:aminodeoxychorismate synthase component I [Allosphingosinicella sp.]